MKRYLVPKTAFPYFRIKMEILRRFSSFCKHVPGSVAVQSQHQEKNPESRSKKIQLCMQFMNIPTKLNLEQLRFMLESEGRQFTVPVLGL